MPFKKGQSGNPAGRQKGARNKVSADREIAKARSVGMDIAAYKELLETKMADDKISDTQQVKYFQEYQKLVTWIFEQQLEIENPKNSKKEEPKEKTAKQQVVKFSTKAS